MSPVAVPAPTFRHPDGQLDQVTNARYAAFIAGTWVRYVVVAGPVGAGETCTTTQRMAVADLWAEHIDPDHLIVACWEQHEIQQTLDRRMRPLAMLRSDTDEQLLATLAELPRETIAYTNPRYSRAVITAALIDQAHADLPRSVKFSKVTLDELAGARAAGGTDLQISTVRHATSLAASLPALTWSFLPRSRCCHTHGLSEISTPCKGLLTRCNASSTSITTTQHVWRQSVRRRDERSA